MYYLGPGCTRPLPTPNSRLAVHSACLRWFFLNATSKKHHLHYGGIRFVAILPIGASVLRVLPTRNAYFVPESHLAWRAEVGTFAAVGTKIARTMALE